VVKFKTCSKCNKNTPLSLYYRNKSAKDGLYSVCKSCKNAKNTIYKTANIDAEKHRNQGWYARNVDKKREYYKKYYDINKHRYHLANLKRSEVVKRATIGDHKKELHDIYKNRPKGFHVDHVIPLQGKNVCGLHVPWNLQYLPAKENLKKSNHYPGSTSL